MEGPSPIQKKPGEDRSHVGTDRDPVRGSRARASKARLEAKGVTCKDCWSEQEWKGILEARQATHGGGVWRCTR